MPECFDFFGAKICFPTLDDIKNAVTVPIQSLINNMWGGLGGQISSFWSDIGGKVDRFWSDMGNKLINLNSALYNINSQIQQAIYSSTQNIMNDLNSLGQGIVTSFVNATSALSASINNISNTLVNTTNSIVNGINSLGQQFVSALGNIFNNIRPDELVNNMLNNVKQAWNKLQDILTPHSPKEPEQAEKEANDLVLWGNVAFAGLAVAKILAEALSFGQIDVTLNSINDIPYLRAYQRAIEDITATWLDASLLIPLRYAYLQKHTPMIPGPSDLVRFVVRECFPLNKLPSAPEEFEKYMQYQGYKSEWARAYWEAHWRLPSPEALYEAFHRGILTEDEVRKYIIWHDYKPEARPGINRSDVDIMLELTYNLPDKVEIRHMMQLGLLTPEERDYLIKARGIHPRFRDKYSKYIKLYAYRSDIRDFEREAKYLYAQGKIDETQYRAYLRKANIPEELHDMFCELAELHKLRKQRETEQTEKQITYSQYAQAFRRGILSEDEFRAKLADLGYPDDAIEILVSVELDRKYESLERALIDAIEDLFEYGIIDENTLRSMLGQVGLDAEEIEMRVQIRKLKLARKKKYLTTTQVIKALKNGIIDLDTAINYLRNRLHYDDFEIGVLVQLYAPGVSAE